MKKIALILAAFSICASVVGQQPDSAKIKAYKKATISFLKKQKIAHPTVNNITSNRISLIEKSNLQKKVKNPTKDQRKVEPTLLKGRQLRDNQFSGYIFDVVTSDDGTTITYYTSCGAPQGPWTSLVSDVVQMEQRGICGNFSQYYAVINDGASP